MHRSLGARERPAPHGKRGGVGGRRQEGGGDGAGWRQQAPPSSSGRWLAVRPASWIRCASWILSHWASRSLLSDFLEIEPNVTSLNS